MATPGPDPANVALLLPFAGLSGAGVSQDYSLNPKGATLYGFPRLTSAQCRGGYNYSGEFPKDGHLVTDSSPDFDMSGMWVVEAFVFIPHAAINETSTQLPFFSFMDKDSNTSRLSFYLSAAALPTYPDVRCWTSAGNTHYLPTNTAFFEEGDFDRWVHIAFQRDATGRVSFFKDGVLAVTGSATITPQYRTFLTINASRLSSITHSTAAMYLSDLRVTIGEAFYPEEGFDVPIAGFLADLVDSLPPPFVGDGYLAGSFPDGITTIEGVPTSATVRVLYRGGPGDPRDGQIVTEVQSNPDGTWLIENVNPAFKYDIVGRKDGFNDIIMANISPVVP